MIDKEQVINYILNLEFTERQDFMNYITSLLTQCKNCERWLKAGKFNMLNNICDDCYKVIKENHDM